MRFLQLTLNAPEENLALDEALLDRAEELGPAGEVVRLWEPAEPLVVLGRSSRISLEVHEDQCRELGIPVLRRSSGGAAIIAGPGCLMYAVVLSYERFPHLRPIDQAHQYVLGRMAAGLGRLLPGVRRQGTSDLTIGVQKFSGNSLRCKRQALVYHGTLLYDFPLELIGRCLRQPPRQPEYRAGRPHDQFVMNLPLDADRLRQAVLAAWQAYEPLESWPREQTRQLAQQRYSRPDWIRQFE